MIDILNSFNYHKIRNIILFYNIKDIDKSREQYRYIWRITYKDGKQKILFKFPEPDNIKVFSY